MAVYRRVYDSRHLQADCQEPESAPEAYALLPSMGYLFPFIVTFARSSCTHGTAPSYLSQLVRVADLPG